MPTNVVVKLFTLVSRTLDDIDQNTVTTEQFKQIVKTGEQFLASFKQYPDIIIAQPLLYKSKQSYLHNLAFNTMAYCTALCSQSKINDLCSQQLLCAILTLYGERHVELTEVFVSSKDHSSAKQTHKYNKRLTELLEKTQQHSWLSGYGILTKLYYDPLVRPRWPKKLNRLQRIIFLAHTLSLAITHRTAKKPPSFSSVLKMLMQSVPLSWQQDLGGLLEYPTLVPPGTLIQSKSGKRSVVLSVSPKRLLVSEINASEPSDNRIAKIYVDFVKRPQGAQVVSSFQQLNHWWTEEWLEEVSEFSYTARDSFPLDKPPAVLLTVQKHLNDGDVNIDKLANQIGEEPAFAEFLKKTATFSNRNKLPVQQVKHGLMMHGYERTNNMLIEQALLIRLNQHYFPLQQDFTQFVMLAAQIAARVAKVQGDYSPEQASNLLCFACSGLFTQPGLKSRIRWDLLDTHCFRITHLIKIKQQDNLAVHATKLCSAWQQPSLFNKALEQHQYLPEEMTGNSSTHVLASLLGMSILLARRMFFNENTSCSVSIDYLQQAANKLSISTSQLHSIALDALANSHSYREL